MALWFQSKGYKIKPKIFFILIDIFSDNVFLERSVVQSQSLRRSLFIITTKHLRNNESRIIPLTIAGHQWHWASNIAGRMCRHVPTCPDMPWGRCVVWSVQSPVHCRRGWAELWLWLAPCEGSNPQTSRHHDNVSGHLLSQHDNDNLSQSAYHGEGPTVQKTQDIDEDKIWR